MNQLYFSNLKEELDSKEELYFLWFLLELYQAGAITFIGRPESRSLCYPIKGTYTKYSKVKRIPKEVVKSLLKGHSYTADFVIKWDNDHPVTRLFLTELTLPDGSSIYFSKYIKGLFAFIDPFGQLTSEIEVKPNYDMGNMTRSFIKSQKWVFDKYGDLISLIKVPDLFKKTWTPERYRFCDIKESQQRRIRWQKKTLNEFIQGLS